MPFRTQLSIFNRCRAIKRTQIELETSIMMDDNDIIVPSSNISTSNTAPAMVHAEQSNRETLKYRGMCMCSFMNFIL
ncbi:unnamed protein product [Brugia pahangi]|uniref:Uncharacterized protein n=1 Tax=Brugia pahangi TaxID=6280 RepID=A0A0N4TEU4_BRUPA|nr:unnamed protein product [Brugia pahangi]